MTGSGVPGLRSRQRETLAPKYFIIFWREELQGWHEINGHEILRRPAKMTAKKMTANGGKKDLLWPQYVANNFFFLVEMIGARGPFNSTVSKYLFATY